MQNEKFRVTLTLKAQNDLRDIATYHKIKVGSNSAKKITDALLDKLELLGDFPELGARPRVERIAEAGFRFIAVKEYLCFYTITEHVIIVHHIVHGSTDYIKRLFD
jgi:toxin ParE1/3/4